MNRYADKIEKLYQDFLLSEGLRREYERHPILATRIADLPISSRAKSILQDDRELYDLGELIQFRQKDLRMLRGFGAESLKQLTEYLDGLGLSFRSDE